MHIRLSELIKKIKDSDNDTKNVLINMFGAFSVKGGALIVSLLATPAYIRFFNDNSALGLLYTLLSVISWVLNFDLGIGNGLRNKLTVAFAKKDNDAIKKYITSSYISIGMVVLIIILLSIFSFDFVSWNLIFNIDSEIVSYQAVLLSVKIVFSGIMLQFWLRIISFILYALQLSSINNVLSLITSILQLLYVSFAASGTNDYNLVVMAVVHTLAVNVPLVVVTVVVFSMRRLKSVRLRLSDFSLYHTVDVLRLGGKFFFVQIAYMVLINTNEYFISLFSDSSYVVDYQIYYKLFTIIGTIVSLTLTPIWSAITKAVVEKRIKWINKLYKKLLLFGAVGCIFEFILIPFLQFVINIWLKEDAIVLDYTYATVFAVFGSLIILNSIFSSIANGMGKLMPQLICFGLGAIIKVPLAYLLVSHIGSWIGVIIATVITMAVYVIIQPIVLRQEINRLGKSIE
ncbi:lipopolysaccharide biosynthesis protein [Heliophilum fasciatum]|uniref:Na+-driven multidrug efflux pump n=1 Tax=Heliophilum fasciatum TaxID=35700 RepID=A0A4R2RMC9_9FIRM|nr:MATE family efflux transporter [Heliophilum fasciatum]MCW2278082.1 O-antigen/teichoic acid export membrane protein [Heliophilum fasciatum]TCP64154.1 Na+-driven multidrug efflux pump [Heliophilum fasciatum]